VLKDTDSNNLDKLAFVIDTLKQALDLVEKYSPDTHSHISKCKKSIGILNEMYDSLQDLCSFYEDDAVE
jgi:hypothetical protein